MKSKSGKLNKKLPHLKQLSVLYHQKFYYDLRHIFFHIELFFSLLFDIIVLTPVDCISSDILKYYLQYFFLSLVSQLTQAYLTLAALNLSFPSCVVGFCLNPAPHLYNSFYVNLSYLIFLFSSFLIAHYFSFLFNNSIV